MLVNREKSKAIAAAKAGMSEKTARRYLKSGKLPSEYEKNRAWRTRKCPFENNWGGIKGYLETNPGIEAKTIFEELQRKYPGKYNDGQLRTLQRRIKVWKATEGPAKEIFFPQVHKPGELGGFDFTRMEKLGITIQKEPFNHMVGHFVLTYSNWEAGSICYSESFESLSECLQEALWELGGVPARIKTDRLSAAVHKDCNPEEFTARYTQLLKHYGTKGDKIQAGKANENGDIEQRHHRLKKAIEQALMLRGSKDFNSIAEYKLFLKKLFIQLNSGRKDRLKEEYKVLGPLPCAKIDASSVLEFKIGPNSTINAKHNIYSVNSRLRGERIKARVHSDHVEIWYAQKKVDSFPRMRGEGNHRIDYRHIIEELVRKPGAFENYRYRDDLYPNSHFRMVYDHLKRYTPNRANKEYLKILYIAFKEGETKVDIAIQGLLTSGKRITSTIVEVLVKGMDEAIRSPEVEVKAVDLKEYDALLCTCAAEVISNA
ncbi:MAG: IS21 family transposase [Candidatus Marinimicrobia bacterium]|nr:IS21 family transposase [Candidatus Neomarinimicrobiota bacterium]